MLCTPCVQVRTFRAEFPKFEKILPRRNWAEVIVSPPGGSTALGTSAANDLVFTFRVESVPGGGENSIRTFPVPIPPLHGTGQPWSGSDLTHAVALLPSVDGGRCCQSESLACMM